MIFFKKRGSRALDNGDTGLKIHPKVRPRMIGQARVMSVASMRRIADVRTTTMYRHRRGSESNDFSEFHLAYLKNN